MEKTVIIKLLKAFPKLTYWEILEGLNARKEQYEARDFWPTIEQVADQELFLARSRVESRNIKLRNYRVIGEL